MFIAKGRMAKNTLRYRVKRQDRHLKNGGAWVDLQFKGDSNRWSRIKRYRTLNGALTALLRKSGHDLENITDLIVAKLS